MLPADIIVCNARFVTFRQFFAVIQFWATSTALSSSRWFEPFIETIAIAFRVTSSCLLCCLVLTRHIIENLCFGQAVASGINKAMRQSRCNSGNTAWKILSRTILLQTAMASSQNQILAWSFYPSAFGNHSLLSRFFHLKRLWTFWSAVSDSDFHKAVAGWHQEFLSHQKYEKQTECEASENDLQDFIARLHSMFW